MLALIITAIGTVLFVMYAMGIAGDGAVLIAAAILIAGGMIKAELCALIEFLNSAYMAICYDEYYDDSCDDCDCGDDEDEEK